MSYQVLARKWRPRVFHEMAGQEHVLQALINALDNQRLHHAYLFTGTRGVGKTTIARILAKCLNCEQGISSKPCGTCGSCVEINEGRFVDLIEVDAASRTKVEDTRELLENVQYAPTRGRYKVYLIDEVHMLSTHSFNALLKTLEEPPPHVKFLLATTDPQKLPVTILSRCLQFNLKNLSPERITEHLKFVLGEEGVPFEESGLWSLARSADGSMRDALSLTDQAIAHGAGKVTEAEVNAMLGTIDRGWVLSLCQAIAAGDGSQALAIVGQMAEHAPDYHAVMGDMLGLWHRVAIAQTVPDALDNRHGDYQQVLSLAQSISREDVQLCYQIALLCRRDLPMAPDPRSGFEMALLRQLAFKPGTSSMQAPALAEVPAAKKPEPLPAEPPPARVEPTLLDKESSASREPLADREPLANKEPSADKEPLADEKSVARIAPIADSASQTSSNTATQPAVPAPAVVQQPAPQQTVEPKPEPKVTSGAAQALAAIDSDNELSNNALADYESYSDYSDYSHSEPSTSEPVSKQSLQEQVESPQAEKDPLSAVDQLPEDVSEDSWLGIFFRLKLAGVLGNTAANLELLSQASDKFSFRLDASQSSLYEESQQQKLAGALSELLGRTVSVEIETGEVSSETPRLYNERKRAARQQAAVESMNKDPLVNDLCQRMGGQLLENTIEPIE
ncbi:DNA polymerase III subunit gamma/tau [Porticoccaceae bacterium LTM1]|nr:DNA polymerase III subunit gamma/tau [Porticoccaceae bacterium LTM1]